MKEEEGPGNRELYALLQVSPEATDEEIRRAYYHWAQVYHPDKYHDFHMKEIATENFQRICEAYEILSDENKRQIYDIYGMEGLTSGLELGPKLNRAEEIKEELERLRRMKEQEKMVAHFRPYGMMLANLSLPEFLDGDGIMRGMAMTSEVRAPLSKSNMAIIGGNLEVNENAGGAAATAVLRHQLSSVSSVEFIGSAGLRALIGVQTTRHLSLHSTATIAIAKSLKDGSISLSNTWTRQLSERAYGNIQLFLGPQSSIEVGWQKKDEKMSAAGELKIGTSSFGASAHYTHHFSSKSYGRIVGSFGSTGAEIEVGGGRKVSDFSTLRMMYAIGMKGIFWKLELHRGGQKLIIPILLSRSLNPVFATGAFLIPTSLYFLIEASYIKPLFINFECNSVSGLYFKIHELDVVRGTEVVYIHQKFLIKPYFLRREKQKALENKERKAAQVQEARAAAEKAQKLLQNVSNRKRTRQIETNGLVITKAEYGDHKALKKGDESRKASDESASEVVDVTVPLNFLVNDSGILKLHGGVKKSGIMGFYDPCPGEPKQLHVEYTYGGQRFEVLVDDFAELLIPQEAHRV